MAVKFECDSCKKPIDPHKDDFIEIPDMTIMYHGTMARIKSLHACCDDHLMAWVKKNAKPSSIISAQNPLGPAL